MWCKLFCRTWGCMSELEVVGHVHVSENAGMLWPTACLLCCNVSLRVTICHHLSPIVTYLTTSCHQLSPIYHPSVTKYPQPVIICHQRATICPTVHVAKVQYIDVRTLWHTTMQCLRYESGDFLSNFWSCFMFNLCVINACWAGVWHFLFLSQNWPA